jgi:hypothetical protein
VCTIGMHKSSICNGIRGTSSLNSCFYTYILHTWRSNKDLLMNSCEWSQGRVMRLYTYIWMPRLTLTIAHAHTYPKHSRMHTYICQNDSSMKAKSNALMISTSVPAKSSVIATIDLLTTRYQTAYIPLTRAHTYTAHMLATSDFIWQQLSC